MKAEPQKIRGYIPTKVSPQNLEAENAVVGGILLDNQSLYKVSDFLKAEDFYLEANQKIFRACMELIDKQQHVDGITLIDYLRKKGELEKVGGHTYIQHIIDYVSTAANISYYGRIVKEKSTLRRIIQAATSILEEAYTDYGDIEEFIDRAEQKIFEVGKEDIKKSYLAIKEVLYKTVKEIEEASNKKKKITGVPTGFLDFDERTGGLQKSDFIVIAGRPSMGKTSFALTLATNAALKYNQTILIFSLEMSQEQLVQRMLASEARIDSTKLRTGFISKEEWTRIIQAADYLNKASIFLDDTPSISTFELRAKARRLKSETDLKMIIIDYLQLMRSQSQGERREQEISEISRSLKSLAKELELPVVAISQLNRAVEMRENKRPRLADLRESGAIEQDADLVAFIYRDEFYNPETKDPGIAEVIIAKHRNGPTGEVKMAFLKEYARFDNLSKREEWKDK